MFIVGEEIFLQIGDLISNEIRNEVFLKYMGIDKTGLKMKGRFPVYWEKTEKGLSGPELFNNEFVFKAVAVDYNSNLIWLREMLTDLRNQLYQFESKQQNFGRSKVGIVGLT